MAEGEWWGAGCRQPLRTIQRTATPQPPAAALFSPLPSTPLGHDSSITPHCNALTRFTAHEWVRITERDTTRWRNTVQGWLWLLATSHDKRKRDEEHGGLLLADTTLTTHSVARGSLLAMGNLTFQSSLPLQVTGEVNYDVKNLVDVIAPQNQLPGSICDAVSRGITQASEFKENDPESY